MRKEVDQYIELARKFKKALNKQDPSRFALYHQCTKIYDKLDDKERIYAQKALRGEVLEGTGAQGQMIDPGDEVSIVQKAISKLPARVQSLIKPEQKYKVLSALGDSAILAIAGFKVNVPTNFLDKPINWETKMSKVKIKKSVLKEAIRETVLTEVSRQEVQRLVNDRAEAGMKYKKASTGEIKTYFGRFVKMDSECVYVGVLGQGLKKFLINNIQSLSPAKLEAAQLAELDEMCHEFAKKEDETSALVHRNSDRMRAAKKKNEEFEEDICKTCGKPQTQCTCVDEACPPGFKGTVKAMKKHPEFSKEEVAILEKINPYALAWWMKNKGYKSHKTASGKDK